MRNAFYLGVVVHMTRQRFGYGKRNSKILSNQEKQLANQKESLEIQRQLFEMNEAQFKRAEKINDRAEKIQDRASNLQKGAKLILLSLIPIGVIATGLTFFGLMLKAIKNLKRPIAVLWGVRRAMLL